MKNTFYIIATVLTITFGAIFYFIVKNAKKQTEEKVSDESLKQIKAYMNGFEDKLMSFQDKQTMIAYLKGLGTIENAISEFMSDNYLTDNEKMATLYLMNNTLDDKNVTKEQAIAWIEKFRVSLDFLDADWTRLQYAGEQFGILDFQNRFLNSEYAKYLNLPFIKQKLGIKP